MKCPNCHSDNPDTSRFCGSCAALLASEGQPTDFLTKTLQTPAHALAKDSLIAGKYRIIGEIGRGGMGVVYKAEDIKLQRMVALKFLPHEWVSDPDARERFIQEARAASALDHPNIYTIYEIGEAENDRMYIAMAFYEGESLRDKVKRGPLAQEDALSIAIQAATGMAKAHQKGIVHRDIKPANILITAEGVAKVVDFGLAKLAGQVKLTREGTTVGTLAYMSPEQAKGETVDQRTDIWSLGVVFCEMLTGELPFKGEHTQGLIYSILNKAPILPIALHPDIPKHIEDAIFKALEKDPSRRYQKMEELIGDLKQPHPHVSSKTEKSIVVLPFENLSADPEQEYFCDGMTEEIITDLSAVNSLRVISRSSAMTFKGTRKKVSEIARDVNVRYVLEGSVRKAGNKLRIVAQLIDAATDAHLWAEKYGGTLDDVFDIQEKVSRSIVDALKLQLTPKEEQRLAERPIPNALAYEFYLKARQEIFKWTEAGCENALNDLKRGLEIVGENALLYAGIAYVFLQYFNLGLKEEESCRKEAEGYLKKAFALDPHLTLSNFVQGMLHSTNNPKAAIRYFKQVLEANPNDFDTLFFLSCGLGTLGQRRAVVPLEDRTIRIDPLNPAAHFHSGFNRLWEGKYVLALEVLRKLHRSFPDDLLTTWSYGLSLAYMDKIDEAGLIFDQIAREQPGGFFADLSLALKCALEGKKSEALRRLDSSPRLQNTRDFQYVYWITECYALIDEKERALDWLEQDVDLGMINYPLMNELDPFLKNIRGEERFKKLMERVKYEWEHFEV
jgi:non-specific serine/threonine protein kinase